MKSVYNLAWRLLHGLKRLSILFFACDFVCISENGVFVGSMDAKKKRKQQKSGINGLRSITPKLCWKLSNVGNTTFARCNQSFFFCIVDKYARSYFWSRTMPMFGSAVIYKKKINNFTVTVGNSNMAFIFCFCVNRLFINSILEAGWAWL